MAKRRFVKRDNADIWWEIELSGRELTTVVGKAGGFRKVKSFTWTTASDATRSYNASIADKLREGYVEPGGSTPPAIDLEELRGDARRAPYACLARVKDALVLGANVRQAAEIALEAIAAIESDIDEHGPTNYNTYFTPTDPDEPSYEELEASRRHYEKLRNTP